MINTGGTSPIAGQSGVSAAPQWSPVINTGGTHPLGTRAAANWSRPQWSPVINTGGTLGLRGLSAHKSGRNGAR